MPAIERERSWPDYRASLAAYARAWQQYRDHPSAHTLALLTTGQALLSAYRTRLDERLWVITEWDRSVTTLLLPAEY